jgi:hypothetical protein
MECQAVRDAVFDALEGVESNAVEKAIREHLANCAACKQAISMEWVSLNAALVPEQTEQLFRNAEQRLMNKLQRSGMPHLIEKAKEYQKLFFRMAAADPSIQNTPGVVLHRLDVAGKDLEIVCNVKDKALMHFSVVDKKTRNTSTALDQGQLKLPSGQSFAIRSGSTNIPLQDIIDASNFILLDSTGAELHIQES